MSPTKPTIVAFTGKAGDGKDTSANYLVAQYGFMKLSFADPLREVCKTVFGLTDAEMTDRVLKEKPLDRWPFMSPRKILQIVGIMFREKFPGAWVRNFERRAANYERVTVADCRFPDECEAVHDNDGIVIRVKGIASSYQTAESGHVSESFIDSLDVDAVVTNDFSDTYGRVMLARQIDKVLIEKGVEKYDRRGADRGDYGHDCCAEG